MRSVILILLATLLVPAVARADLSSSQARKLITKTAGMSLSSGSVRIVRKPVMMDQNLAEAVAEIDLVFRFNEDWGEGYHEPAAVVDRLKHPMWPMYWDPSLNITGAIRQKFDSTPAAPK